MARRFLSLPAIQLLILVTLLTSTLAVGGRAVAADDSSPGFSVKAEPGDDPVTTSKGYFVYDLASGKKATGHLRLANPTDQPITVDVTAVDAITSNTGGSAFATDDLAVAAVGAWLKLAKTSVTLEPGNDLLAKFTVKVPKGTPPGQYLAGLAATTAPPDVSAATPAAVDATQAGATITMRTRYVIGVEVDVPGDWTPSLTIANVALIDQPSGPIIGVDLVNDGATFLKPTGTLTVTDADGTAAFAQPIEMGTFVTGTAVTYPIPWPPTLAPGRYAVHVELSYGTDQTALFDGSLNAGVETAPTIAVSAVVLTEARDQSSNTLQFVTIDVTVENPGQAIANARLTLHLERDGETVEDLVLGDALTFAPGATQASQRYLPLDGWQAGTYTFSVALDAVDATGNAVELSTANGDTSVTVE